MRVKLWSAAILAIVLLATAKANSDGTELLDVALNGVKPSQVQRITVIRNSPEVVGRIFTVNSERIKSVYSLRLDITADVPDLIAKIKDTLTKEAATAGCSQVSVSANDLEVEWAILLYDYDGHEIGSMAISRSGTCSVVNSRLYSISGDLVPLLKKILPIMP